ncbi:serine/threonine-protein kinase Nek3 [Callorhinchus milii]|uniref:non-specific serine/threonine protein kinase n=1 Tax=Callorhinchus milii TaxID=7868 RepID=A0A4W3KEE3_CALMI|nr:serine/threonine-protein kinase Nek3 [Callorhinchus milii]XP_007889403.1 serine/threonine-protein kinase Nek3 [Callorhinchus milii]XP_007889404.1 serine/threonine-protein kinase Nek3 [Callorhinchus milii]|eukprot:gi/632948094/ref/XP_007889402.1/ PREDICTED: serine/threonine-protein kinase Nek3 [Callorhinchus milii]
MDNYTVLKMIGEGSFGRALLVQPHNDSQQCVMKEIHLSKDPRGIQKSRQEAILLAKMKHPNIVAFKEAFEADSHLYIVMEYCDGGDLMQNLLRQKKKLFPEEMVLNLFIQICLGMKHIHDRRVLHRDIKSKNIFFTKTGVVKLGDFGSACLLNDPMAFACTYVGTPYYVSPEIWESKPYNNKSDVWALGCVLYELCTLRHPFQSNSWKNLIMKVCKGSYLPVPNHYSFELQYIIKQMFKRNPKDRPSVNTILARRYFAKLISNFLSPEMMRKEFSEEMTKKKRPGQPKAKIVLPKDRAPDVKKNAPTRAKAGPLEVPSENNQPVSEIVEASPNITKWNSTEGENVAKSLAQKPLEQTVSQMEVTPKGDQVIMFKDSAPNIHMRKQWKEGPSNTVLNVLENAQLTSSGTAFEETKSDQVTIYATNKPRKLWNPGPPEAVLNFLKNANLSLAFKTYSIDKPASGTYLIGPLSADSTKAADNVDGEMETIEEDPERLEPRSDDEDTEFEDDSDPDWVEELKKMVENTL